tara:strand:- start:99 stop:341 length:243 start_codon:yes stop_codon:yes gene_type:complete
MDNLVVLAVSAAVVYFFVKFIEMRFIKRESEPLKGIIKDSAFVAMATGLGGFIVGQMGSLTNETQSGGGAPNVFTDDPGF